MAGKNIVHEHVHDYVHEHGKETYQRLNDNGLNLLSPKKR